MKFRPAAERDEEFLLIKARVKARLEGLGLCVTVQKEFETAEHWDAAEAIAELAYDAGGVEMQRQMLKVMT